MCTYIIKHQIWITISCFLCWKILKEETDGNNTLLNALGHTRSVRWPAEASIRDTCPRPSPLREGQDNTALTRRQQCCESEHEYIVRQHYCPKVRLYKWGTSKDCTSKVPVSLYKWGTAETVYIRYQQDCTSEVPVSLYKVCVQKSHLMAI